MKPVYFRAMETKDLAEESRADRWQPDGWYTEDGELRMPVQLQDEHGADCDVFFVLQHDGTTRFYQHSR